MDYLISKTNLHEQVMENLLKALTMGKFLPGERLREEEAADLLQVSRTPVRAVLALMGKRGILIKRRGGGYTVPNPSAKEIQDVFEVRQLLEPQAARKAAVLCTDEDLAILEDIVQRELDVINDDDPYKSFNLGMEFRQKLFSLCGNSRLTISINEFVDHLRFMGMSTLQSKENRTLLAEGHQKIVQALKQRDAALAAKAVKMHLKIAKKALIDALHVQINNRKTIDSSSTT